MNKGIIYVMSTVVDGLLKIGQTQTNQYENRMNYLENNGYANITGLKREFAICVTDYQAKEKLLHTIFNKSRVASTELFAIDIDIVISLLSSFEGEQIYPTNIKKDEIFKDIEEKRELLCIPNGTYYLQRNVKNFGKVNGKMKVENGKLIVLKGSMCANIGNQKTSTIRKQARIKNNILQENIICNSPSAAGEIILARSNNGWIEWKTEDNKSLSSFRV